MAKTDDIKMNAKDTTDKFQRKWKEHREQVKQRATMKYQGALLIPLEMTPRPQTNINDNNIGFMLPIENLHCTIMLPSELKVLKNQLNCSNKELKNVLKCFATTHPAPPIPQLGAKVHTAYRYEERDGLEIHIQRTNFLRVINRKEMQDYLDTVTDALGLPRRERFFHVSIANETGNGQDSIGDINASDCTYGDEEQ